MNNAQIAHSLWFSYDGAVDTESTQGITLPVFQKFNFGGEESQRTFVRAGEPRFAVLCGK